MATHAAINARRGAAVVAALIRTLLHPLSVYAGPVDLLVGPQLMSVMAPLKVVQEEATVPQQKTGPPLHV